MRPHDDVPRNTRNPPKSVHQMALGELGSARFLEQQRGIVGCEARAAAGAGACTRVAQLVKEEVFPASTAASFDRYDRHRASSFRPQR